MQLELLKMGKNKNLLKQEIKFDIERIKDELNLEKTIYKDEVILKKHSGQITIAVFQDYIRDFEEDLQNMGKNVANAYNYYKNNEEKEQKFLHHKIKFVLMESQKLINNLSRKLGDIKSNLVKVKRYEKNASALIRQGDEDIYILQDYKSILNNLLFEYKNLMLKLQDIKGKEKVPKNQENFIDKTVAQFDTLAASIIAEKKNLKSDKENIPKKNNNKK